MDEKLRQTMHDLLLACQHFTYGVLFRAKNDAEAVEIVRSVRNSLRRDPMFKPFFARSGRPLGGRRILPDAEYQALWSASLAKLKPGKVLEALGREKTPEHYKWLNRRMKAFRAVLKKLPETKAEAAEWMRKIPAEERQITAMGILRKLRNEIDAPFDPADRP